MRFFHYSLILTFVLSISGFQLSAEEKISPYFKVGTVAFSMEEASSMIHNALKEGGFTVIGEYHPEGSKDLKVIAYTRKDLQSLTLKIKDRGALASILKIGLKKNGEKIDVSMLNPMYLFYAYLRNDGNQHLTELEGISNQAKNAMKAVGTDFIDFGGYESIDDLKKYHYMAFMPYFNEPVELKSFSSFEEGISTIGKNLEAKKGNTVKVYELVFEGHEVAIFGVGLLDAEEGEAKFLPIIGEDHIAAMPYEIILMGTEATILHGKYRFALHWPELSMGQFMKISSTPGNVEEFLKALTE